MNRKTKRLVAVGVLLVALIITGVTVLCSLGGGDGYEAGVSALKTFIFECDNFTLDASAQITLNGQQLGEYNNYSRYSKDAFSERSTSRSIWSGGDESVSERYLMNGVSYFDIDHENNTYHRYNSGMNDMFIEDTELNRRTFDLWKLFADFMAGDARRNFVKLGQTDGVSEYQLRLNKNQLPEFVNIVSSIFGLAADEMHSIRASSVNYENSYATFAAWYEKRTGEALADNFFDIIHDSDYKRNALYSDYIELFNEMKAEYRAILDASAVQPCLLYVYPDGEYKLYSNMLDYSLEHDGDGAIIKVPEGVSVAGLTQNGLYAGALGISSVELTLRVDAENRPTHFDFSAQIDVLDVFDVAHKLALNATLDITDYGSTVPEMFDIDGYAEYVYESEPEPVPTEPVTIEFNGQTYTVYPKTAARAGGDQ